MHRIKTNLLPVLVSILIALNVFVLTSHAEKSEALQSAQYQVVEQKKARALESKKLTELSEQKTVIDTSLKEERLKSEGLQQENESLKVSLQAKKEREAQAALAAQEAPKPAVVAAPVRVAGDCNSWLAAAGVPDIQSALTLIQRESGCNPNAVNPSSGACGVAQELPCGKSGCSLGDGACQVRWMNSYVHNRYGSWANALGHSYAVGWY